MFVMELDCVGEGAFFMPLEAWYAVSFSHFPIRILLLCLCQISLAFAECLDCSPVRYKVQGNGHGMS